MSEVLARTVEHPDDRTVVALTPAELVPAQASLVDWCQQKVEALKQDLAEAKANLEVATRNRWSRGGLARLITTTERTVAYYEKIQAAVEAGYLIIPNIPVDLFAVRVQRDRPHSAQHYSQNVVAEAKPDLLPAGEGRYVDDRLSIDDVSFTETKDGKVQKHELYKAIGYDDVAFPVVAVNPHILTATEQAMALKLFDQLGVVTGHRARHADPIVVGQLIDPRTRGRWSQKVVTFFIGWWLDTRAL